MSKPKRRAGLQKDFESIFEGVWIPKKPHLDHTPAAPARPEQYSHAEHAEQIQKIISSMKCEKDFECFKSGFQKLCKIKSIGDGKVIECSPENQGSCEYRFTFMDKNFCKCELRYYVARNLKK